MPHRVGPKVGVGQHQCAAYNCGRRLPWYMPFCGHHEKMLPAAIIDRLKRSDGRYRGPDWDWDAIVQGRDLIAKAETKGL